MLNENREIALLQAIFHENKGIIESLNSHGADIDAKSESLKL